MPDSDDPILSGAADAGAGAATGAGEALGPEDNEAVADGADTLGSFFGVPGLGKILKPVGLASAVSGVITDQVLEYVKQVGQAAAAQKTANVAEHTASIDAHARGILAGLAPFYKFEAAMKQAGYDESSAPRNVRDLKTAAERAIYDYHVQQTLSGARVDDFLKARAEAGPEGNLTTAREAAGEKVDAAKSMPDADTTLHGIRVHSAEKDQALREAQADLETAGQNIDRNQKLQDSLVGQIKRAAAAEAQADLQSDAAQAAALAAVKNATGPATAAPPTTPATNPDTPVPLIFHSDTNPGSPGASSAGPAAATSPLQATQQLLQQQVKVNQVLTALLDTSRQNFDEQSKLLQGVLANQALLLANQTNMQDEINRTHAQLTNLQSTGMR